MWQLSSICNQDKLETYHPIFDHPERMTQVMLDHLKSKNSTKVFPTLSQGIVIIQSNRTINRWPHDDISNNEIGINQPNTNK